MTPKCSSTLCKSVEWVEGWRDRRRALRTPSVIVSPAGMLKGGPSQFYLSKVGKKANNAIFLVSYQIPGTPGRQLMEKGVTTIDGKVRKIKAHFQHFDFSSHCGATMLKESLKRLGGKPKVFVVHGAEGNCELLANWAKTELGLRRGCSKNRRNLPNLRRTNMKIGLLPVGQVNHDFLSYFAKKLRQSFSRYNLQHYR